MLLCVCVCVCVCVHTSVHACCKIEAYWYSRTCVYLFCKRVWYVKIKIRSFHFFVVYICKIKKINNNFLKSN